MEIEKKYMSKLKWKRVLERGYSIQDFEEQNLRGKVTLLWIKKVSNPCYKEYSDSAIKIADNGYYWLQIGIENANYWITAMYNENKKLIQYYIDITKKNYIINEIDPFYEDLFLDLVVLNDNVFLLDEDELKQALKEKVIDEKDYTLAYNVTQKLKGWLVSNKKLLDNLCEKYFEKLYIQITKDEKYDVSKKKGK